MKIAVIAGFLQASEDLHELEKTLVDRGFEVDIADVTELLQRDDAKTAAVRLCERFQGANFWVGYSMGARLALYALPLAQTKPHGPTGVVLLSGSPGLEDAVERQVRRDLDEARAASLRAQPQEFIRDWGELPLFASLRSVDGFTALQQRRQNRVQAGWTEDWAHALQTLGPGRLPSQWNKLPHLRCPLLFLAGGLDARYVEIAHSAVSVAPHATARVLPGAGHALPLECPQQVADEIERFVHGTAKTQTGEGPQATPRATT